MNLNEIQYFCLLNWSMGQSISNQNIYHSCQSRTEILFNYDLGAEVVKIQQDERTRSSTTFTVIKSCVAKHHVATMWTIHTFHESSERNVSVDQTMGLGRRRNRNYICFFCFSVDLKWTEIIVCAHCNLYASGANRFHSILSLFISFRCWLVYRPTIVGFHFAAKVSVSFVSNSRNHNNNWLVILATISASLFHVFVSPFRVTAANWPELSVSVYCEWLVPTDTNVKHKTK